ncbi:MAG: twin-arginine translocase TatA/TatE family subunit [Flavobacteriales bacterium]|nr:twin-arginine translocase TatA/TatE family subunit [Flavobacteriales bacterium]
MSFPLSTLLFISGSEIIVVFLIFLLLFGAKSIPGLARTMGRTMRQFKDASQDIQREMSNAAGDIKETVKEHRKTLDQMGEDIENSAKDLDT